MPYLELKINYRSSMTILRGMKYNLVHVVLTRKYFAGSMLPQWGNMGLIRELFLNVLYRHTQLGQHKVLVWWQQQTSKL